MITVDEALAHILSAFSPLPAVDLPLLETDGLVLAADVVAPFDLPPFANSAMDGFAVWSADTVGATTQSPVHLHVVGHALPGQPAPDELRSGTAIRIMTGAPIPPGADAVVRFEETDNGAGSATNAQTSVAIFLAAQPGQNLRPAGDDVAAGQIVLPIGTALGPPEIGLLAALGNATARVHRRPKVGVLSTGNELVPVGSPLAPGKIHDSNGYALASLVRRSGGEPITLGIARDSETDLTHRLKGAADLDLIVTSGGVSVGDYDMVKQVLQAAGSIELWQVKMKPGKPLAFGHLGQTPLLGLPGNPVAAMVAFQQFGRPAIRTMLGQGAWQPRTIRARLMERVDNRGGRRNFARVIVTTNASGEAMARPVGKHGSAIISSMAKASGLMVIPETIEIAEVDDWFDVQLLDGDH